MATDSKVRLSVEQNRASQSLDYELRSPGLFAKWPLIGLTMFLLGGFIFSGLAYSLGTKGPFLQWDLTIAKTFRADTIKLPASLVEYILFAFFLGKEIVIAIGIVLAIYFLYKRFWRELTMVLIGLGGGSLLWYWLSHYFNRPRPEAQLETLLLRGPSFPSGTAMMAILCYGLLAYLLVPRMPSRFWKWAVGIFLAFVVVLIGLSSILRASNYLTDVLAGYALGLAWAGLIYTLMERFFKEEAAQNRKRPLDTEQGLRAPGWFKKWPLIGVILILLGGISLGVFGYELLTNGPLVQLDLSLYKQFLADARAAPPGIDEIMLFGFFLGKQIPLLIVTLLIIYFLYKRFWRELAMLLISSAVGSFVWNFIIAYFARPRPPEQTGLVIKTVPSFPSGHAMNALICYGFLAYLLVPKMPSRFWKWTLAIVAVLIILFDGFSRVFQGNHYFSDVLAGYALGLAWACLVYTLIEGIFLRKKV